MSSPTKMPSRPRFLFLCLLASAALVGACGDDTSSSSDAAGGSDSTGTDGTSGAYPLVDSNQLQCYDDLTGERINGPEEGEAFYGQDAQYQGSAPSYSDNDDGTIADEVTGLTWQQDPPDGKYSWYDAETYCADLDLGGQDDWRLPEVKELFSLSDFGMGWPYIDTDYFDIWGTGVTKDEQFWSNAVYEVTAEGVREGDLAFGVNIGTGHIKAYEQGEAGSTDNSPANKVVRCVRGDVYGENDFVDNDDGTITDEATGLTWTQDDSGEGLVWEDALSYCESLLLADHDDWRLPGVRELQSIADYGGSYPAIDATFFNTTDSDAYFWSSTSAYYSPLQVGYYYAWYVAFGFAVDGDGNDLHGAGAVRYDTKAEGGAAGEDAERYFNYARCVRGGDVSFLDISIDESIIDVGTTDEGTASGPNDTTPPGTGAPVLDFEAAATELNALGCTVPECGGTIVPL